MTAWHTSRMARAATTLLVFVQALSLQLLCFCGHCPRSFAVGVRADDRADAEDATPVHACCRHAREEALAAPHVQGQGCCGDEHSVHVLPALVRTDVAMAAPALAYASLPRRWRAPDLPSQQQLARAWLQTTGPPGHRPPLFLELKVFLI